MSWKKQTAYVRYILFHPQSHPNCFFLYWKTYFCHNEHVQNSSLLNLMCSKIANKLDTFDTDTAHILKISFIKYLRSTLSKRLRNERKFHTIKFVVPNFKIKTVRWLYESSHILLVRSIVRMGFYCQNLCSTHFSIILL